MNGGQLDGATLKVELSDLPIRPQRGSRPPIPRPRNGRDGMGGREMHATIHARAPVPGHVRVHGLVRDRDLGKIFACVSIHPLCPLSASYVLHDPPPRQFFLLFLAGIRSRP